ncbi:phage minor head protein [Streptomyces boncukensis]|uniref:Phage head morphogenesis domain-containing protein n=1 Tax=Streptomyces boncukensis TaxID=2711219 RepID=A0A6G4WZF7_9ACTN|nr:phage minor head protein [Streptomyces boncukensis]NGO70508.1 hypothetical protein [Streptomyces boncukensis]
MAPRDPWLAARMHQRAQLAAGEAELHPAVQRAVAEYLAAVRAGILDDRTTALTAAAGDAGPDWAGWPDASVWTRLVQRHIAPAWRAVWGRSYRRTAPQAPDGAGEGRADDEGESLAERLRGFPGRVWERLRRAVRDGLDRGESPAQLRDRVATLTTLEGWTGDALTMTRTEVHTALNAGALAAALDEQARTRRPWTKVWLATNDARTRATHRAAEGQQQPLRQPFTVGAAALQFPGDPRGPAGEVINCRCAAQYRPL